MEWQYVMSMWSSQRMGQARTYKAGGTISRFCEISQEFLLRTILE